MAKTVFVSKVTKIATAFMNSVSDVLWDLLGDGTNAPTTRSELITNLGISTSITNLTTAELTQLENIDSVTISNAQWTYLGSADQAIATTDSVTFAGLTVNGNITVTGTVDGRDIAADGTKLDGIESGATADQTDAEIRAAVEAATDSNVFTDADHTKLNGIETGADVTDAVNVTAAGALMLDTNNSNTSHIDIPVGTTVQRPGSPQNGNFRYNSDDGAFEGYIGGSWGSIGGGAVGGGSDGVGFENDQTTSGGGAGDYTITNSKNMITAGPFTIASGDTITVGSGENWVIVGG